MTTFPRPSVLWRTDPDDTDGRAIYRNHANALASRQLAYEKRQVRLKVLATSEPPLSDSAKGEAPRD